MVDASKKAALFLECLSGRRGGPLAFLEREILAVLQPQRLAFGASRLFVGCSGGLDSTALLFCLFRLAPMLKAPLGILHVNHRMRPEAPIEEHFTRNIAKGLRIPWRSIERLVPLVPGRGQEAALRDFRHAFFGHVLKQVPGSMLALGHHLDDRIETFLMFFLRGSGTRGLSSLRGKRGDEIVRPLIETPRSAIEAYANEVGLPFFEDTTNQDEAYLRNRIRARVLPALMQAYPGLYSAAKKSFRLLEAEANWLEVHAKELLGRSFVSASRDEAVLQTAELVRAPDTLVERALFLLIEALFGFRSNLKTLIGLVQRLKGGKTFCLHFDQRLDAYGFYGKLVFRERVVKRAKALSWAYKVFREGIVNCPEAGIQLEVWERRASKAEREGKVPHDPWIAYLDSHQIVFPLLLRPARFGDRLKPLGMGGHSKKIKEVFQDYRIDPGGRWTTPVLEIQGEIVWVIGLKRAEAFRVLPETQAVLEIHARPVPGGDMDMGNPPPIQSRETR
jgi:tRNA(Ile)-lysidine synthase